MTSLRRLALSVPLVLALAGTAGPAAASSAAGQAPAGVGKGRPSFVVVGDLPYGDDQLAALPGWVDDINAVRPDFVVHTGDIKSGSQRCDTDYYQQIRTQFDRFAAPLVYTPGDNEWTDCHRVSNGAYQPLERLDTVRKVFFDRPHHTLGQHPIRVATQARRGLPENVRFRRFGIDVAALHVVGSNDDLQPWTGIGHTAATPAQVEEERVRMAGAVDLVRQTVATAVKRQDRAVVLALQADMFDPSYTPTEADISAFRPLVQALVDAASFFDGPVYLFNGDSHNYNRDRPLAAGSVWLERYGVRGSAENLTRITNDGSGNNTDFIRVTVNRPGAPEVLSVQRIPYSDAPGALSKAP